MTSQQEPAEPDPPLTARQRAHAAHVAREQERARQRREDEERRAREQAEKDADDLAEALANSLLGEILPGVEWAFDGRNPQERRAVYVRSVEDDDNAKPLRLVLRPATSGSAAGISPAFVVCMPDFGRVKGRVVTSLEEIGEALIEEERKPRTRADAAAGEVSS